MSATDEPTTLSEEEARQVEKATHIRRYKCYFQGVTSTRKAQFKANTCVLPISVGQDYHEGEKFKSLLRLVERHFARCKVIVGDYLQRHTLGLCYPNRSPDEIGELALQLGQEWLKRNTTSIEEMSVPSEITLWKEVCDDARFAMYTSLMHRLYDVDSEYTNVVLHDINAFLARKGWSDSKEAVAVSVKYVIEEDAAACVWVSDDRVVTVYPFTTIESMKLACSKAHQFDVTQNFVVAYTKGC